MGFRGSWAGREPCGRRLVLGCLPEFVAPAGLPHTRVLLCRGAHPFGTAALGVGGQTHPQHAGSFPSCRRAARDGDAEQRRARRTLALRTPGARAPGARRLHLTATRAAAGQSWWTTSWTSPASRSAGRCALVAARTVPRCDDAASRTALDIAHGRRRRVRAARERELRHRPRARCFAIGRCAAAPRTGGRRADLRSGRRNGTRERSGPGGPTGSCGRPSRRPAGCAARPGRGLAGSPRSLLRRPGAHHGGRGRYAQRVPGFLGPGGSRAAGAGARRATRREPVGKQVPKAGAR